MSATYTFMIDDVEYTHDRADKVIPQLLEEYPEFESISRTQVQNWIESKKILLNGKSFSSKNKLKIGDEVTLLWSPPIPLEVKPENIPIPVIYEDEHLIVVNKPPRMSVHPSPQETTGTLVNALLHQVKDLSGIGGFLRPGIVHRIDKDTSGALVVCKNDRTHRAMAEIFSKHALTRKYWALCYGAPTWKTQHLETQIGRNPKDRKKMAVVEKNGKHAVSDFLLEQAFSKPNAKPFASWIEATLQTGRTHQVRIHLTHLGHSLLGDPVYGEPSSTQAKWKALPSEIQKLVKLLPGQALHARILAFQHPITHAQIQCEASLPSEFHTLFEALSKF